MATSPLRRSKEFNGGGEAVVKDCVAKFSSKKGKYYTATAAFLHDAPAFRSWLVIFRPADAEKVFDLKQRIHRPAGLAAAPAQKPPPPVGAGARRGPGQWP